jgi:hypothetical protein
MNLNICAKNTNVPALKNKRTVEGCIAEIRPRRDGSTNVATRTAAAAE